MILSLVTASAAGALHVGAGQAGDDGRGPAGVVAADADRHQIGVLVKGVQLPIRHQRQGRGARTGGEIIEGDLHSTFELHGIGGLGSAARVVGWHAVSGGVGITEGVVHNWRLRHR